MASDAVLPMTTRPETSIPARSKPVWSRTAAIVWSLVLFVLALRELGTARTGAYFSTAPFIGALLSLLWLGEAAPPALWAAGLLMAVGVWLHLGERHDHRHTHDAITHRHPHRHDAHHQHPHNFPWDGSEPHSHAHRHAPLTHKHPHYPDIHHRHRH